MSFCYLIDVHLIVNNYCLFVVRVVPESRPVAAPETYK